MFGGASGYFYLDSWVLANIVHDSCVHILNQKKKFAEWLESGDDIKMSNCLLILIARVINMLNHQLESQGES